MKLVEPSAKYKKSFLAAAKTSGKNSRRSVTKEIGKDFQVFIKRMRDYEKGRNLPKGHVQSSYYWLIDKSEFIGEATIRHKLTESLLKEGGHIGYGIRPIKRKMGYGKKILALALRKAKRLGIKKALITCDDDNIGSWKIIEMNGGILQNKIRHRGKLIRRYWINI